VGDPVSERRVPCRHCGAKILVGARKCRSCKTWLDKGIRPPTKRAIAMVAGAALALGVGFLSHKQSPVEDAPPLTPLGTEAASADPALPSPLEIAPDQTDDEPSDEERTTLATDDGKPVRSWRSREFSVDVHPLDVAFSPSGRSVYVTTDDASLREYHVASGQLMRVVKVPVRGDRIRVLHDRWVAVLQNDGAAHIPIVDTKVWEKEPRVLVVGMQPADILALPGTTTAVAAARRGKRITWFDLEDGSLKANITVPHTTTQLHLLQSDQGHYYVAAMGQLFRGGRPAGAWIDLFDPSESPFGATRRSISAGRQPGPGAVTNDRGKLLFADRSSNSVSLLSVDEITKVRTASVGQGPIAAFLMHGDHYGITLDAGGRTATVIDIQKMRRSTTLMLPAPPREGAMSEDGKALFVSLGNKHWPPKGAGAVVIAGDPPNVVAELKTGRGASRVATSPDGKRAAVASWLDKSVTIIEPVPEKSK
jgi:DNA-binding beta-propeller fold protein YncE